MGPQTVELAPIVAPSVKLGKIQAHSSSLDQACGRGHAEMRGPAGHLLFLILDVGQEELFGFGVSVGKDGRPTTSQTLVTRM